MPSDVCGTYTFSALVRLTTFSMDPTHSLLTEGPGVMAAVVPLLPAGGRRRSTLHFHGALLVLSETPAMEEPCKVKPAPQTDMARVYGCVCVCVCMVV